MNCPHIPACFWRLTETYEYCFDTSSEVEQLKHENNHSHFYTIVLEFRICGAFPPYPLYAFYHYLLVWNEENALMAFSYYFIADNGCGTGLLSVRSFIELIFCLKLLCAVLPASTVEHRCLMFEHVVALNDIFVSHIVLVDNQYM